MEEFDNARNLIEELERSLKQINELIEAKQEEHLHILRQNEQHKNMLDEIINEKGELERILNECSRGVCQYKNEFELIKKRHSAELENNIRNQKFHFFLCYRGEQYAARGKTVIDSHREIIDREGFCWWAKFFKGRKKGGEYKELEPFGESIEVAGKSIVAQRIKETVDKCIQTGEPVYLYNYNPNPPEIKLYVCNVTDFFYRKEKLPYEDNPDVRPQCTYIPDYYFFKRDGNCSSCKKIDTTKCKLRFESNFWFKIDKIKELIDIEEEFTNLINCFTSDSINFAIPILYPLLVFQKKENYYFHEMEEPIPHKSGYVLNVPKREKGRTKLDKVEDFFDNLNEYCKRSFTRVEMTSCSNPPNNYKLQKSSRNDEIFIYLPSEYRSDGSPSRYAIFLDKRTTPEQKKKVEELITSYLG